MKKILFILGIICFILSGCGRKLTSDSFDDIGKEMSTSEVIEILGKPSKTILKQTEISELIDTDIKTSSTILSLTDEDEFHDEYQTMHDAAVEKATVKVLLDRNESIKCFVYKYSYENSEGKTDTSERNLYFYDDKLIAY